MKLISYVNSIIELDMEGLADFAEAARGENRHVLWLTPDKLSTYQLEYLKYGVVVIWEGDANEDEVRDAFLKQWVLDINGEGPGLSYAGKPL